MGKGFEKELKEIKKELLKWHPKAKISIVEEAFYFAKKAHAGQKRKSGEPYFIHPIQVAKMVAGQGLNEVVVSAALLHDILEDTNVEGKKIKSIFGEKIYELVKGLTKLDKARFDSEQEYSTAVAIKTLVASSKNLRVLIIKIFDKLHNLRTIKYLPKKKQKKIAADVLTIYVPLVHKLGMHNVKYEMEDITFKIVEPKKYSKLKKQITKIRNKKSKEIKKTISIIKKNFPKTRWVFVKKTKSIYSAHTKMIGQGKQIEELNDLAILKIIVSAQSDCYDVIGKIHSLFKPIPFKIKDFIAIPESGIYKSIHLQVIGPAKKPLKVYVFTEESNEIGEKGITYYLRDIKKNKEFIKKFTKILRGAKEAKIMNQKELADSMNLDFHSSTMIVFSKDGKVIDVPMNSTALDFSFFRNEKKAKYTSIAKINGKVMPLWTKLNPGDRVRIFYSRTKRMNSHWIPFVNSTKARQLVKKDLRKEPFGNTKKNSIKFRIESIDRLGLLSEQTKVITKNSLDIKSSQCKMYEDDTTAFTEFIVVPQKNSNIEKTIKELKQLKETLNVTVTYSK